MFSTIHLSTWNFWSVYNPATVQYGNQKCIFDGPNRLIYINPNVDSVSVKEDIYSGWKEWLGGTQEFPTAAAYLPAIRTTGGDPIGGGEFTGDVYFLINNWRLIIDHSFNIDGVIYSDNFPSPFLTAPGTNIVTNKVSALVLTVSTGGGSGTAPTAQENAEAVWNQSIANSPPGTAGDKLKQSLTTGNFLGLK